MASDQQSGGTPDWLIPALIIVFGLIAGLAGWGIYALTSDDGSDEPSIARELELYTSCLSEQGANVPVVETRSDGGFAVIVPGSLLEHDVDFDQWEAAAEECRPLQPTFESLFGDVGIGLGGLAPLLEGDLFGNGPEFGFGSPFGQGNELEELCERARDGSVPRGINPRQLREMCGLFGD